MAAPLKDLPPLYYHDHFQEVAAYVQRFYGDILGADERNFLDDFFRLETPARCLYLRMCNRKKHAYREEDIRYAEIPDRAGTIASLRERGWLAALGEADYRCLLKENTKPALIALSRRAGLSLRTSLSKSALVEALAQYLPFNEFERLHGLHSFFKPARRHTFEFLLYLYFGKLADSMTSFALRDLGIAHTNGQQDFTARFHDFDEARAGFFYNRALRLFKSAGTTDLAAILHEMDALSHPANDYIGDLRNSALFMAGQIYERGGERDQAIGVYRRSQGYECRERLVRLLYSAGHRDEAAAQLDAMIADPSCDEEHFFALDFFDRKFGAKKTSRYTDLLRAAREISIDECYRGMPEYGALLKFEQDRWTGYHVENALWHSLFGLLFWDELFDSPGAMSGSFEFLPFCLKNRAFYDRWQDRIESKLNRLRNGMGREDILAAYDRHCHEPNGLVAWYEDQKDLLGHFLENADGTALTVMMEKMARDFYAMTDGYPDLVLLKDGQIKFVEIKAEGDQLRRNQLVRMMQLRAAGFDVEIFRVRYQVDRSQVYVVVDVETTGGRPPFDRVTEIGAVKFCGGKIVAEWHSLINPEKRIPAMITQLTGITNEMVADAPLFADIADDLHRFMNGAVFAAHNVNFDYGFIASEFRRLEMPFRMPKICTCASMRRHYPGHASYSLGALCREYAVPLTDHHRALCDARAAAELLKLVNFKRMAA